MLSTLGRRGLLVVTLAVILIGLNWGSAGFAGGFLHLVDGARAMLSIFAQMLPPNLAYLGRIGTELSESLLMALFSVVTSWGIVILAGWVSSRVPLPASVRHMGVVLLRVMGAVHALAWALLLVRGLGAGSVSGLVALTLVTLSNLMTAKRTAAPAPSPTLPPALLDLCLTCLEKNIRLSVVLGLVGAGGIGELLYANIQFQLWPNVSVILGGIVTMVLTVDALCGRWRQLLAGQSLTSQQLRHRAS